MSGIETLPEFLERTAQAPAEPFLEELRQHARARGATAFDAPAELARIRAYIAAYYVGVTPLRSFVDASGLVCDCVAFDQLPSVQFSRRADHEPLEKAPIPSPGPRSTAESAPKPPDSRPPCPDGSVALERITLERLISFGSMEHYFQK